MTLAVERVESRPLLGLRELRRLPDACLSDGWVESLLAMPADEGLSGLTIIMPLSSGRIGTTTPKKSAPRR